MSEKVYVGEMSTDEGTCKFYVAPWLASRFGYGESKAEVAMPSAPPTSEPGAGVSLEDVRKGLTEMIKTKGVGPAQEILRHFNVGNVTELEEMQYAGVLKAINQTR